MKMIHVRRTITVLAAALLLLFSSCASQDEAANVMGKPEGSIEKIEITDISFEGIELLCTFSVENPYPLGINLTGFDYDFRIEDSSFISGRQDKGLSIPARGESIVELPLSFTYRELRESFASVEGEEEAAYTLMLGIEIDAPLFDDSIRVTRNREGTLPIPKTPEISLKEVVIRKFGLSTIFLEIGILIENPNIFEARIGGIDYDVSVDGESWAEGSTGQSYVFSPKDSRTMYIPLELNYMRVGRTVVDILMSGRTLTYSLSGSSSIGAGGEDFDIPDYSFSYEKEGTAAIIRP